jgi:hypothetical protein
MQFFSLSAKLASALPMKSDIFEYREIKPKSRMYDEIAKDGVVIYERAFGFKDIAERAACIKINREVRHEDFAPAICSHRVFLRWSQIP